MVVAVEKVGEEHSVVADEHKVDERRKMILLAVAVFAFPQVDDCPKVLLSVVSLLQSRSGGLGGGPVALVVVVEGTATHFGTAPVAAVESSWQPPSSGFATAFVVVADVDSD